jgi:hypothetical protein
MKNSARVSMIIDLEKRLDAISEYNGVPYGRAHMIFNAEEAFSRGALRYRGFLALSDAFKCFFLETVELINVPTDPNQTSTRPCSDRYLMFVPRLAQCFRTLCGAERVTLHGYPYEGYTLLRNTFDSVVLLSAALQGFADFYSIEGLNLDGSFDAVRAKRLRKVTEQKVRKAMTGDQSGLSPSARFELARLNDMFDWETHGGRLSLTHAIDWMKGHGPLFVVPEFSEKSIALFLNRYLEIGWMTHRLVPFMRCDGTPVSKTWCEKWRTLDEAFSIHVASLTTQLKKPVGAAVVEFVNTKFPFNEASYFPEIEGAS